MYGLTFATVLARALASFLQYVGVIKPEHLGADDKGNDFQLKFYDLTAKAKLQPHCQVRVLF